MPTYVYRCARGCGDVEQVHPMADAPAEVDCPACADSARRTIAAPSLGVGNRATMRLHDATRASADRPDVVSAPPANRRGGTRVTTDPRHRRLPRP